MIRAIRTLLVASAILIPGASSRAAETKTDGPALLMRVITQNNDPELQLDVLRGMYAALEGRRNVPTPQGWSDVYAKLAHGDNAELRTLARQLATIYGDKQAIAEMQTSLEDAKVPVEERRVILRSLLAAGVDGLAPTLQHLITDKELGPAALAGLAAYDDPSTPGVILADYPKLDLAGRRAALNTLAGRLTYAKELTAAVRANKIPKTDLTAYTIRQLRDLGDDSLNQFVDEVYGVARASSGEKAKQIANYKAMLTDALIAKGNASRGRAVFAKTCAQCHTLYGAGGAVGPDLTGSQRASTDYVVQNVVDPSALIAREFQVTLIRTKDKRVVSGIATETPDGFKVVTETGTTIIPKTQIDKLKKSELSMMPEGLLTGMSDGDVVDLFAYLRTTAQVPLPTDAAH
jgi:putative heme-binding domain-containing protein